MKKGSLEVICGSMFSGKTEELMRRLKRAEYAQQQVLTIKHHIDTRRNYSAITSHDGGSRKAHPIKNSTDSLSQIVKLASESNVIGIDEIHFFPSEIIAIICTLIEQGKRVIVAGCDLTFQGEAFRVVSTLLSIADKMIKLRAICLQCGNEANHTQRIIDGLPAKYNDPIILVGAEECYEARCRNCFVIDRKPYTETMNETT